MKILPKVMLLLTLLGIPAYKALNHDYIDTPDFMDELHEETEMNFDPQSRGLQTAAQSMVAGASSEAESEDSELEALSSPVDVATVDESTEVPSEEGIININTNSEIEHNRNFMKISSDLKAYEDAYKACLDSASDSDFSMETIEKCVGADYQFVYDDIDYERRKILARADNTLRIEMIRLCYNQAGADLVLDNACDLLQKDTLDLMWDELNFDTLIEYHREKYVFVHAKMPDDVFTNIINRFKDVCNELSQLMDELYAHRDLTISRLKRHIDERTALIAEKFRDQADHPSPRIKKDVITIDETLIDHPNYFVPLDQLPRPMVENGQDQSFAVGGSPWAETFAHNIGPDHYAAINTPYEVPEFDDPLNVFNNNYKKRKLGRSNSGRVMPGAVGPINKQVAQSRLNKIRIMGRVGRFGINKGLRRKLGVTNRGNIYRSFSARPPGTNISGLAKVTQ